MWRWPEVRDESDSFELLSAALEAAGTGEADAVLISTDRNISRFANSTLHQNMSEISASLTLRVIDGGRAGMASTTSLDRSSLSATASLAREAARRSEPMPRFSGLYQNADPLPAIDCFAQSTASETPAAKAVALAEMFEQGRARGISFAGSFGNAVASVACGNTHGLRRYAQVTVADATVIAIHGQASGYATTMDRDLRNVDVGKLGKEAMEKATMASDRLLDLEPGSWDVILEPPAVGEVCEWLNLIAFTGQSFEEGSSFFVGNQGKRLVGADLTIADDATDQDFLPFPFDLEGLPKRRVPLIENGIVRGPMVDKAYSDRLGIPPNGGAASLGGSEHGAALHISVAPGTSTREELIASTERGIWVTRFNYVNGLLEPRTAMMTGTTRDGTFLIRDGKVAGRLPNLRWTQSILEAFSNVAGVTRGRGKTGMWWNHLGGTIAPTMKIRNWQITGVQRK
jgi:PmbA protein